LYVKKRQSIPCRDLLQAQRVTECSSPQISRQGCQPYAMAAFPPPPKKYSWYSFLLEVETTPGSQGVRKDYFN